MFIPVQNNKFKFNLEHVVFMLNISENPKTNQVYVLYFENGKTLHITNEDASMLLNAKDSTGKPLFIRFADKVYIIPEKICYVKNNFENKEATRYKVTIYTINNYEFFASFPLNDFEGAKKFYDSLTV